MAYCCIECIIDFKIKEIISEKGILKNCSFCKSKGKKCIDVKILQEEILPVFNLYELVKDKIPKEKSRGVGGRIWREIDKDWNLFSKILRDKEKEIMLRGIINDSTSKLWNGNVYIRDKFMGAYDDHASRRMSLWETFKKEIKENNRFFPQTTKKFDEGHLALLFQYVEKLFPKGHKFIRSRICKNNEIFNQDEMGKPPEDLTTNGRANPIGISYLYLANDEYTAIAEKKPSIRQHITLGEFELTENLRIIDLRQISPFQFSKDEDLDKLVRDVVYLNCLGEELSQPINMKHSDIEYIPTQYLCEFIKKGGWDGVAYRSYLGKGYNIALFDDKKVKCINTKLYKINEASWGYEEVSLEESSTKNKSSVGSSNVQKKTEQRAKTKTKGTRAIKTKR